MTDEYYLIQLGRMKELTDSNRDDADKEEDHILADRILCNVLTSLGYKELVAHWEQVKKWYS